MLLIKPGIIIFSNALKYNSFNLLPRFDNSRLSSKALQMLDAGQLLDIFEVRISIANRAAFEGMIGVVFANLNMRPETNNFRPDLLLETCNNGNGNDHHTNACSNASNGNTDNGC